MKSATSIFVVLLFIPFFLVGVLLANVRFQILAPRFWLQTFEENNVYGKMAVMLKDSSTRKLIKEGSNINDTAILTDLITKDNVKDVISKNIVNFLAFIDGKDKELDVYIPINKLPKELLPVNYGTKPDTIPATQLLRSFNIKGITSEQLMMLSQVGFWARGSLIVDIVLVLLFLVFLYLLTGKGKRFWGPGSAFIVTGVILLAASIFGEAIRASMINDWPVGQEPSQLLLGTFSPFILQKILLVWIVTGAFLVIFGIILFFVKKKV